MTRDELHKKLHHIPQCADFELACQIDSILDHDQAQRQEIARLNNLLCSVDKDHAVEKLNKEIARLWEALAMLTTGESGSFLATRFPVTFRAAQAALTEHPSKG